jgi:hypothetical protein
MLALVLLLQLVLLQRLQHEGCVQQSAWGAH